MTGLYGFGTRETILKLRRLSILLGSLLIETNLHAQFALFNEDFSADVQIKYEKHEFKRRDFKNIDVKLFFQRLDSNAFIFSLQDTIFGISKDYAALWRCTVHGVKQPFNIVFNKVFVFGDTLYQLFNNEENMILRSRKQGCSSVHFIIESKVDDLDSFMESFCNDSFIKHLTYNGKVQLLVYYKNNAKYIFRGINAYMYIGISNIYYAYSNIEKFPYNLSVNGNGTLFLHFIEEDKIRIKVSN